MRKEKYITLLLHTQSRLSDFSALFQTLIKKIKDQKETYSQSAAQISLFINRGKMEDGGKVEESSEEEGGDDDGMDGGRGS